MIENFVFSEATQKKLSKLHERLRKAEDQVHAIKHQIEKVRSGDSPIQPGDRIKWVTGHNGKYEKVGIVISVSWAWRSFEYRCHVINKTTGKRVGYANVDSHNHHPEKV